MIRTKLQAKIKTRVVSMPGRSVKQLSKDYSCTLDTIYRMIKAGDLVSIRRRVYDPNHKFTVTEVKALLLPGKLADDRYRAKIGAPTALEAQTQARLNKAEIDTGVSDYDLLVACMR